MSLTKRDIFFFLERLSEQTISFVKYHYKKQFAIFRNFKIKGGKIKLTSYVLQYKVKPSEVTYVIDVHTLIAQVMSNYAINSMPCLYTFFDIKKLSECVKLLENKIVQELSKKITVMNTIIKTNEKGIACLIDYNIMKQ